MNGLNLLYYIFSLVFLYLQVSFLSILVQFIFLHFIEIVLMFLNY